MVRTLTSSLITHYTFRRFVPTYVAIVLALRVRQGFYTMLADPLVFIISPHGFPIGQLQNISHPWPLLFRRRAHL
jgi:hypothetical protein